MVCRGRNHSYRPPARMTNFGPRIPGHITRARGQRMGKNFDDAIGKGKEVFGEATDNSGKKIEGKFDQAKGRAKKKAEEVGDKARKHAESTADKAEQTFDKD